MPRRRPRRPASVLLALAASGLALLPAGRPAAGQSVAEWVPPATRDAAFPLSIRSVMRAEENVGVAPDDLAWTDDGAWLYFRWRPGGRDWDAPTPLWRVGAGGGAPEELSEAEAWQAAPLLAGGDVSPDRTRRVAAVEGDLWLVDRRSLAVRRLTHTEDAEGAPLFAEGGDAVLFRRGDDLYRLRLETGALTQLTRFESGPPEEDDEPEGQRAFLEAQQRELFEHIRRGLQEEAREDSLEAIREAGDPPAVHLRSGERVAELAPTRDGARVLVRAVTPADEARGTEVPTWVTESGYTEDFDVRTKVGDAGSRERVGLLTTATGELRWLAVDPGAEEAGASTLADVAEMGWNEAGTHAFLFVVSGDDKDRWLWGLEAATGDLTLLDHLEDEAWVAGPCFGCVGFLPSSERVWFVSEATGYAHLRAVDADGTDEAQLTSGEWEVLEVELPRDVPGEEDRFLLTTNEGSPFDQHLWWMDLDGSDREPLTTGEGRFEGLLAPGGDRIALLHDVANRPPELFLADPGSAMEMERVTTSPTEAWASFGWIRPEIVHFEAEDGTMVPARIYRPRDLGAEANGAGVVFVHGAGYLHNVHNYWSSYYREYQFNHLLAAAGYTVLDIDYRGSAGYGRDWRTAIYRWMGGKDLSDQVDGARWLVAEEGVDPDRVGIYGGSYGGFITLMALFTAGETFTSGAALRSVTDWAHYNHGYTSRILNQPQDDEEAYRRSSPIYFAEGFGPDQHLVILHGMEDTNVHFSDVVRLAQRLIELGKENWEFAVYPVENHGFREPASWTDEYRRIFELFERTISRPGCTDGGGLCPVPEG